MKKTFFLTFSKTTEPIELKFTHKIRVGPEVVLGIFFKMCLFILLFVRRNINKTIDYFVEL